MAERSYNEIISAAARAAREAARETARPPMRRLPTQANSAPTRIGYGVPVVPWDVTSLVIDLQISDSLGNVVLDAASQPQTITVWRNAQRGAVTLDLNIPTVDGEGLPDQKLAVLPYIITREDELGCRGWLLSGEIQLYQGEYKPNGTTYVHPDLTPTSCTTDGTGNPANPDDIIVTGHMALANTNPFSGTSDGDWHWVPWLVLKASTFGPDHKVKVSSTDGTAGYLDDELIVDNSGGVDPYWIDKAVVGTGDKKLLLTHRDRNIANLTQSDPVPCNLVGGGGVEVLTAAPVGRPYIEYQVARDEYDAKGHSVLTPQTSGDPAEAIKRFIALPQSQAGLISVRNDSGGPRSMFDVLGINAPVPTPDYVTGFTLPLVVAGVTPTKAAHVGRFVVLAEDIDTDGTGLAWITGICPTQVSLGGAVSTYADIADGSNMLEGRSWGAARIVWRPASLAATGPQWCLVCLGDSSDDGFPMGTIVDWDEDTNEDDSVWLSWGPKWCFADGRAISDPRSKYNGSNVPNLQGRSTVMRGDFGVNPVGQLLGTEYLTINDHVMHSHTVFGNTGYIDPGNSGAPVLVALGGADNVIGSAADDAPLQHDGPDAGARDVGAVSTSFTNYHPSYATTKLVKYLP